MKSIFSSKVFWLAVLQGVVGVWAVLATSMPDAGWIIVGKSILDVALRFVTSEAVKV